jgi:hypothetical protein
LFTQQARPDTKSAAGTGTKTVFPFSSLIPRVLMAGVRVVHPYFFCVCPNTISLSYYIFVDSMRRDTQDKEHSLVNAVDKVKGTENVKSHESSVIQTLHSDLLIHEADINLSESPV